MLNVLAAASCNNISGVCGADIPQSIPNLIHLFITLIQVFIPIILIILGMLDMGKAVTSNDEKTMKEAQGRLIKRVIYAVVVFLIVALVKLVVGVVGDINADGTVDSNNLGKCIDVFVNGCQK